MQLVRAYKYRIYPNVKQEIVLNNTFGCVRFVWNKLVENFNSWTPDFTPPKISEKTLKDLPEYFFLKEVSSQALQQKRIDFEETKSQFFNKKRKIKLGRMKFKSRGKSTESFRIPGAALYNKGIDFDNNKIKLPKMTLIKAVFDRKFTGEVRSVTISKNKAGQYFASVLVKEEPVLKSMTSKSIGIDLGLAHLLTLSDGTKIKNPRWFRENQSKLAKAQQHFSRKKIENKISSKRRDKQKLKVAQLHLAVVNQRNWVHHNLSSYIVKNYDNIFMEDLNIAGMKRSTLAKSVSDAGWATLVSQIQYKADWYGKSFHKVDRFFASTKTCSSCGHKQELSLKERDWTCDICGAHHDRDENAAKNILMEGMKDLYNFTSDELADYIRGENVRPVNGLHPLIGNLVEAKSKHNLIN